MLLYIHGFNSSSRSGKARQLADWMAARGLGEAYVCPDLPPHPLAAIERLQALIAASKGPAKLVGSSLGGFYATYLAERHGLKAVLINPCVACHEKLAGEVGRVQKNWHDGSEYLFTAEHLAALRSLALPAISDPGRYLLLVEQGDEVLDWREAAAYYQGAQQHVLAGGDHSFTRFAEYIPAIVAF
ncbi:MAG: esterase [Thiobacillaceae bacterium]|nr:esterase [Thiobacillaceae bacterium]MCX7672022.1 esterase [Thiobacillaceae bacterium]MDW8323742.1 YqiA/YcfP family alpha/beta fold hydrolase [Burkholderiales bacterium]